MDRVNSIDHLNYQNPSHLEKTKYRSTKCLVNLKNQEERKVAQPSIKEEPNPDEFVRIAQERDTNFMSMLPINTKISKLSDIPYITQKLDQAKMTKYNSNSNGLTLEQKILAGEYSIKPYEPKASYKTTLHSKNSQNTSRTNTKYKTGEQSQKSRTAFFKLNINSEIRLIPTKKNVAFSNRTNNERVDIDNTADATFTAPETFPDNLITN